jgi:PIN domain nuclease of toxin-antitoxin system
VSIACLWELAIKAANGKLPRFAAMIAPGLDALLESLRESGLELLPIELSHVLAAGSLPQHHRDPFDRLMIAQAIEEKLTLITSDAIFPRYQGLRILYS